MSHPLIDAIVVEDNHDLCDQYAETLQKAPWIDTEKAHSVDEATKLCRLKRQVLLLIDPGLPDAKGVEAIEKAKLEAPGATIVCISGNIDLKGPAIAAGAHSFIDKCSPESIGDGLIEEVTKTVERHRSAQIFASAQTRMSKLEEPLSGEFASKK